MTILIGAIGPAWMSESEKVDCQPSEPPSFGELRLWILWARSISTLQLSLRVGDHDRDFLCVLFQSSKLAFSCNNPYGQ